MAKLPHNTASKGFCNQKEERHVRARKFHLLTIFISLILISAATGGPALGQDGIVVGAVQTTIGPLGPFGREINAGLNDALMMANGEGGINGKKIKYVMAEGNYEPKQDQTLFEKLISENRPLLMFGNSTELSKSVASDITKRYKVLYSGATFSTELANSAMHPSMFVPGPTYGDQMGILLKYIAKERPRARVAFFRSATEFGNESIKFAKVTCDKLRLNVVGEEIASIRGGEVSAQVQSLNKVNPDYVIVHGFLVAPVPEFIKQCREVGMKCKFVGTFWGATELILEKLGPLAEGYLAVNPYSYWWMDNEPMIRKIRAYTTEHYPDVKQRPVYYMQGFLTGMIFVDSLRKADKAGQLNYDGLVTALQAMKDFDTGGLTAPLTIKNNRFPVARVWKANVEKGRFEPESDWIKFYLD